MGGFCGAASRAAICSPNVVRFHVCGVSKTTRVFYLECTCFVGSSFCSVEDFCSFFLCLFRMEFFKILTECYCFLDDSLL